MPPKKREVILNCPKCSGKGFLRKKHYPFHLSQKNKVSNLSDFLDYISKLYFNEFRKVLPLSLETRLRHSNSPLKDYNRTFTFLKFNNRKIKEFEVDAISSLIKKGRSRKQIYLGYTDDLTRSIHLKPLLNAYTSSDVQTQKVRIIVSRRRLIYLFNSVLLMALKKWCELDQLHDKLDSENELIGKLKWLFYRYSMNVDKRDKWQFPLLVNVQKDYENLDFDLFIPEESGYWLRCRICRKSYPDNTKLEFCTNGHRLYYVKEKPSKSYLKKKSRELRSLKTNLLDYAIALYDFKRIMFQSLCKKESLSQFHELFEETKEQVLENLHIPGKTYYRILHYEKGKSFKKECNMSIKSDFLNIDIRLYEYNHLIKQLILIDFFNIGTNSYRIRRKLVSILRELNFPERYIQSKIDIDFRKYARTLIVEKQVKIIFKHENMLEKILRDVQKENYINIWLIRRDIDLTLYKLINFAINKKLIPAKQITAYRLLVKEFVIGENIPKDILFNVLPFLLRINNYNEKIKLCLESKSSN